MVEMMNAAEEGRIRGMYIMGENPVLSDPDIAHVRNALESLEFLVVQDIFMSETAELADVVLPAFSFAEKDGTFTNTERRVQRVRPAVFRPGEAREDWRILCDVSTRMGYPMGYTDSSAIMDEIASSTSIYGGISHASARSGGRPAVAVPDTRTIRAPPVLHRESFHPGKGQVPRRSFPSSAELPDERVPVPAHHGTAAPALAHRDHDPALRRARSACAARRPRAEPGGRERHSPVPGETAVVRSRRGRIEIPVAVTQRVDRGTVFVAFHFKEHPANALTIAALDPVAKIPEFKACAVSVEKRAAGS